MTIKSDEHWLSLVDAFQSAALGDKTWDAALQGLAEATGSCGSQLIGRKSDLSVLYNVMTDIDPELQRRVIELQPLNPRPPVVQRAPILHLIADRDVISPEQTKRDPFYQEVLLPADKPFFCATVIERQADLFVTLGLMRSHADGCVSRDQRQTFALLTPHVRAAIRLQSALEGKSAATLVGCMEALSIPLWICDASGRVGMLTRAAEHLVSSGGGLQLRHGRLRAAREGESRALEQAIAAALATERPPGPPVARTVVIHDCTGREVPVVLDIFAFPCRRGTSIVTSFVPRVMIVACGQRRLEARRAALLSAVYGLTAAEVAIAQLLAEGTSAAQISLQRRVSIGTVRVQTKAILSKLRIRRQAELVARFNRL